MCLMDGKSVTPEMDCYCRRCSLYLETCKPIVFNGFIFGECDRDFCDECQSYEKCISNKEVPDYGKNRDCIG